MKYEYFIAKKLKLGVDELGDKPSSPILNIALTGIILAIIIMLLSIAIVILIIAGINYTNFNTALVPMRIKSINTQKVLGSTTGMLRRSLIFEALIISLFSFALSLLFLRLLQFTSITSLIDADMSFVVQKNIIIGTAFRSEERRVGKAC